MRFAAWVRRTRWSVDKKIGRGSTQISPDNKFKKIRAALER
jgi:hypothetical protein